MIRRIEFRILPGDSYYESAMRVFRILQNDFGSDKILYVTIETKHQYNELRKKLAKRATKKKR